MALNWKLIEDLGWTIIAMAICTAIMAKSAYGDTCVLYTSEVEQHPTHGFFIPYIPDDLDTYIVSTEVVQNNVVGETSWVKIKLIDSYPADLGEDTILSRVDNHTEADDEALATVGVNFPVRWHNELNQ